MPLPASPASLSCYSCNTSDFTLGRYTDYTKIAYHSRAHIARLDRLHDPMGSLSPPQRP
jgi:hypothetical protein